MSTIRLLRLALLSTTLLTAAPAATLGQQTGSDAPAEPPAQGSIRVLPPPATAGASATVDTAAPDVPLAAAFGSNAEAASSQFGEIADIQACPYKQIRAAYDEAVSGKDTLDTLAVEREILILCEERNALVAKLLAGEKDLAALLAPEAPQQLSLGAAGDGAAPSPQTNGAAGAANEGADPMGRLTSRPPTPPSGQSAQSGSAQSGAAQSGEGLLANPPASLKSEATTSTAGQCAPAYATRYVSPGNAETGAIAVAGLIETTSRTDLLVKVGDALPGGYAVARITAEGVTLSRGGEAVILPRMSPIREAEGFYVKGTAGTAAPPMTPFVSQEVSQ
ncbi:MAG: hypothetical protein O9329_18255 [Microcystis sp. LE19-12.2C]|nr:hypothetical protein [Microcystis sp. LE19-12.2C]MCZ8085153.1 hypothetical protein [Paracoccaceae bacterium]